MSLPHPPIFDVNASLLAETGERFDIAAEPDFVDAGFAINVPVLLRLPNGNTIAGTRILFTVIGLNYLMQEQAMQMRPDPGTLQ